MNIKQIKSGTVKTYDCRTGRGVIISDDGGRIITVDRVAVDAAGLGQLAVDQVVAFTIANGNGACEAADLWATWSNR